MVSATPTIHLNGTSRETLQEEYRKAYTALNLAREQVANNTVHMRDYYILENGREEFEIARREHRERLQALDDLQEDMQKLYNATEK